MTNKREEMRNKKIIVVIRQYFIDPIMEYGVIHLLQQLLVITCRLFYYFIKDTIQKSLYRKKKKIKVISLYTWKEGQNRNKKHKLKEIVMLVK